MLSIETFSPFLFNAGRRRLQPPKLRGGQLKKSPSLPLRIPSGRPNEKNNASTCARNKFLIRSSHQVPSVASAIAKASLPPDAAMAEAL